MKVVSAPSQSMLPECVGNVVKSVNSLSRIMLKTCEGTERTVTGIDKVATTMLAQQQKRLMAELEAT